MKFCKKCGSSVSTPDESEGYYDEYEGNQYCENCFYENFFEILDSLKYNLLWDEIYSVMYKIAEGTTFLEDNILQILEVFDEILEGWRGEESQDIPHDVLSWRYDHESRQYIPPEVKPHLDGDIQDLFIGFFKDILMYSEVLNNHFPKILKWFDELVKYWYFGLQPYPLTSFIEGLKGSDMLKKNFVLILKWFEGQDFENIYEPFKKLIENIKGTPLIEDHFLDILDTFAKMPRYHSSNYREQALLELSGSFDTEDLEKMINEDQEGFKNSVDNFPAFEWRWLVRDFIRCIKGTKGLETHFTDLVRFFENSILKRTNGVNLFLELFEAIKDSELLKHHYSAIQKLYKKINISPYVVKREPRFKKHFEVKKYFENGYS